MLLSEIGTTWLEQHMLTCPSKKLFYLDCPGCGLQRSLIALLKGDLAVSWKIYPPSLFILITLAMLALHLVFQFRHGALLLKIFFIITLSVITVNYIYKVTNHQLL